MEQHMKKLQKIEVQIPGDFNCAEIAGLVLLARNEGHCYIKNHMLMLMVGQDKSKSIKQWHDNVTKQNLMALKKIFKELDMPLPFPKDLEMRENELKKSLKDAAGSLMEGEALVELWQAANLLERCYTEVCTQATNSKVLEMLKANMENVSKNYQMVCAAKMETEQAFPPPMAKTIIMAIPPNIEPLKFV